MAPRTRLDLPNKRIPVLLVRHRTAVCTADTLRCGNRITRHNTGWVLVGALGTNQAGFVDVRTAFLTAPQGQRLIHLLVHGQRQNPVAYLHRQNNTL
jgi:hypothetical protein